MATPLDPEAEALRFLVGRLLVVDFAGEVAVLVGEGPWKLRGVGCASIIIADS